MSFCSVEKFHWDFDKIVSVFLGLEKEKVPVKLSPITAQKGC